MKKLLKSIGPNRQYPRVPPKPEVDLDFRGHSDMLASRNSKKMDYLTSKNVGNKEITKIHKTESKVPSSTCKTGS